MSERAHGATKYQDTARRLRESRVYPSRTPSPTDSVRLSDTASVITSQSCRHVSANVWQTVHRRTKIHDDTRTLHHIIPNRAASSTSLTPRVLHTTAPGGRRLEPPPSRDPADADAVADEEVASPGGGSTPTASASAAARLCLHCSGGGCISHNSVRVSSW